MNSERGSIHQSACLLSVVALAAVVSMSSLERATESVFIRAAFPSDSKSELVVQNSKGDSESGPGDTTQMQTDGGGQWGTHADPDANLEEMVLVRPSDAPPPPSIDNPNPQGSSSAAASPLSLN